MSLPTLQQLRYLVAIADAGTFAAAAEVEFVSQPALSAQIKELERKLGATLLERSSRGTMLTRQGTEVVDRARAILRDVDDLVRAAQVDGSTLHGHVELAVIPTLAPYVLPQVVRTLTDHHREAQLHIREVQTAPMLTAIRRGEVDLGLLALPISDAALETGVIGEDPFHLAVSEHHPLAKERGTVKLDVLRDERVILLQEGHCLRDQVLDACHLVVSEPSEIQATSMAALAQMVAAGLGVTLLPRCAEHVEAGPGRGVVTRRFAGKAPVRTVGLVWRKSSPHAGLFREFARLLADAQVLGGADT
jgi:LysR family transcriptional regulator, hydrogen peroxide-inducible genes activator